MEEQVEACRQLWTKAPASFHGKKVSFDRAYSLPFPVQPGGVPIWFGLPPTERNFDRIARHGGGWYPMKPTPESLRQHIAELRAAYQRYGQDPANLTVRVFVPPVMGAEGRPDLPATLESIPEWVDAGATTLEFHPVLFCSGPQDVDGLFAALSEVQEAK